MVGAYLEGVLPLPIVNEHSNSTNATMLLEHVNDERIMYATAITFFTSLFLVRKNFWILFESRKIRLPIISDQQKVTRKTYLVILI